MPHTDIIEQHRESLGPQMGQRTMVNERSESEEEEEENERLIFLLFISIVEIRDEETSSGALANTQVTVQPRSEKGKTKCQKENFGRQSEKNNRTR